MKTFTALKKHYRWLLFVLLLGLCLIVPAIALSWPSNHVDSSVTAEVPYCISCHGYKTGYMTIESINGKNPRTNSITIGQGGSFDMTFRTIGLGYGRFTVAGAIQVNDSDYNADYWTMSQTSGGDVPWSRAQQSTLFGAPAESPYMWVTAFPSTSNPNGQKGVTLDDGSKPPSTYVDRNEIAHDEQFTVKITASNDLPFGTYQLRVQGIGTASTGTLGYNEEIVYVTVYDDTTPPSVPTGLSFSGQSTSCITVSWDASTDYGGTGVDGYEIYRSTSSSGAYEYIGYSTTTSFTDRELSNNNGTGKTYYYRITAVDHCGNVSGYSNTGSTSTLGGSRVDEAVPIQPIGLKAYLTPNPEDDKKKIVRLEWSANVEGDIVGYNVYRATEALGSYAKLNSSLITESYNSELNESPLVVMKSFYYEDLNINHGTTYYYKVVAVDEAGKASVMSSYVSATPAVDEGDANPHGNYKNSDAGMCTNCHSTHSSRGSELIYFSSVTDSCYTCHDGSQSKYNTKAAFDPVANPSHHKVPEGRYSCDVCHNPHYDSEKKPKLLAAISKEDGEIKNGGNEFCWACHGVNSDLPNPFGQDHKTAFINSKHNTLEAVSSATGITCRNCHAPHGSKDYPLIITTNSANFCINCHKDNNFNFTDVLNDNGTIKEEKGLNNSSNYYLGTRHEQNFYGRNTCTMCHEPHGHIDNRYMLRNHYNDKYSYTGTQVTASNPSGSKIGPVDWSQDWVGQENDTICFRCHDSQYYVGINGNGSITVGSNFGNGNGKNYHSHATKWQTSCRACHDPHSGKSMFNDADPGWVLDNNHYVSFDWAVKTGIASPSTAPNPDILAFIPAYGINLEETGFSCAVKCHNYDHYVSGTTYKSYIRTGNSPALRCEACHDFDNFDRNSRHPVLEPGPETGYKVTCEQCHIEDHTKHDSLNPYGLKATLLSDWVGGPSPGNISTTLDKVIDPDTGDEVPAYKDFCYHCHGKENGVDERNRKIISDQRSLFEGKPHSLLERDGSNNPYGPGIDNPCMKCHEHHSSTNVRLLRASIDGVAIDAATDNGKIYACMACHDGSPGDVDISAKYNAESHGGHYIKDQPTKKLLCTECHDPHGTGSESYLLDTTNKYQTGISFPTVLQKGKTREFCLACHPTSDEPARVYDTTNTINVGQINIEPLPYPDRIADHKSSGTRECVICHDAHKPWPATGGEDRCYSCHSSDGEAQDIRALAGLEGSYPGLQSHHKITDADTSNNTCISRCHTPHPHDPRANLIKTDFLVGDEKSMCLKCHASVAAKEDRSPYTIDASQYEGKPHDYVKPLITFSDNSTFKGNCDKCHVPHGSMFPPLLKKPKDELCLGCHDGVTRDGNGDIIPDIKTQYEAQGHRYKQYPTAKMYCAECHVPHGSTNKQYLRDKDEYARKQTIVSVINGVYQQVYFPENMNDIVEPYKPRQFCITCHIEYKPGVTSYVYYSSETAPRGQVIIPSLPKDFPVDNIVIEEHTEGRSESCTICHNPHDPEPVGSDYNCFKCHGKDGYTTRIEPLTGLGNVGTGEYNWPSEPKKSYHPIWDANSQNSNDCMLMCHKPHMHDPRSNMLKDKRSSYGDVTAPAAPADLTVYESSAIQADLAWPASTSEDVFGYYVYRKVGAGGTWEKYGSVNNPIPNEPEESSVMVWFYDGGLKPGTTYYYKVSSRDRVGNESAQTAEVSITPSLGHDYTKPTTPNNLKVTVPENGGSTRLTVSWTESKDNYKVAQYQLYRSTNEHSGFTLVASTGLTSITDSGLQPKRGYYYKVRAVDDNGNVSELSAPVYGETLAADAYLPKGYYTEGNTIFEITDVDGKHTNEFPLGSNAIVKVKNTAGLDNSRPKAVYFKDHLGVTKATFTNAIYSKEGNYDVFTFYIQFPTANIYSGAYQLEASVWTTGGVNLKPHQVIKHGATVKGFKFYKDAARTQESVVFRPGDTVYAKVTTEYPGSNYYSSSLTWSDFDGPSNSLSWQFESPQWEYGNAKFRFTVPNGTDGWWYMINFFAESSARRHPLVADYGAMLLIKRDDTDAPEPVSSNPVLTAGTTNIRLRWGASANSDGDLAAYNIYRATSSGGPYYLVGSTTTIGFMDYGLKPATTYYYQVKAVDLHGNLSTASTVSKATLAEEIDNTPPNRPKNLTVMAGGVNQMNLSWTNPSAQTDGALAYAVYRSRNNIDYEKVGISYDLSYTDTGLRGNTLYYYKVAAYDRSGNISDMTAPVSAITARSGDDSIEGTLCMSCHEQGKSQPAEYDKVTVTHKISSAYYQTKHNVDFVLYTLLDGSKFESNCTKCHVPHGSDNSYLLRAPDDNNLCFICHTNPSGGGKYSGAEEYNKTAHGQDSASSYSFSSSTPRVWPGAYGVEARIPGTDEGRCYNCHTPHGRFDPETGDFIKNSLVAGNSTNVNALCNSCHGEHAYNEWGGQGVYEKTAHGNTAVNAKMQMEDYGTGECINCHEPHKDSGGAMLRYPVNVAGEDKNLLCLKCHDRENVIEDTGLFDGSKVYNNSKHGLRAQWLDDFNTPIVYNSTDWEKGVCMNCHNSHGKTTDGSGDPNKVIPKMLVMNDGANSEICNKCHEHSSIKSKTAGYPGFSVFSAGVHKAKASWPGGNYYTEPTPADQKGKCINCHDPHGTAIIDAWGNVTNIAGNVFDWEEKVCYECHDGSTAASNLKFFENEGIGHLPSGTFLVHSFDENIKTAQRHVECMDCHNVHAVQDFNASEALVIRLSKAFRGVSGVKVLSSPGVNTPNPNNATWKNNPYALDGYEYEWVPNVDTEPIALREYMVCFKCHSSYSNASTGGKRVVAYLNPNNVSTHGFSFQNKTSFSNPRIQSNAQYLFPNDPSKAGYAFHPSNPNRRYNMTCSDCHGNPDTSGGKPRGPHGSNWNYILKGDPRSSSFCNECHPAAEYGNDTSPASLKHSDPGGDYHGKGNHYGDLNGKVPTEVAEAYQSLFGTNVCRYCHFAGYMQNSDQYISLHGENAAFSTAYNGDYRAYRGLNGYFIQRANYQEKNCRTAAVAGISSYGCSHPGGKTW